MTTGTSASTTRQPARWRPKLTMIVAIAGAAVGLATIPALSASASPAAGRAAAVAYKTTPGIVNGNYTLHFSWGCTGHYADVVDTFNPGGILSSGGANIGNWVQQDGTLMWQYTIGPAKYAGNVAGPVGTGVSSTFAPGGNGCWYLTAVGITGTPNHGANSRQTQNQAGNSH